MSVVSGITIQITVAEESDDESCCPLIDQINGWLAKRSFLPLASVEKYYGGSKHPQVLVFGAGFNYFPEAEFEKFFLSLKWKEPETVVLLINPEDGPTKVIRPIGRDS